MKQKVNIPFFYFARLVLKTILKPLSAFQVIGAENLENLPDSVIIISNHVAFADTFYYIFALPFNFVVCGAKPKYFSSFFKRTVMKLGNIIKVQNENSFIADCGDLLKQGERILIYPEMGRSCKTMGEFKTWASSVCVQNNVAVLPCYIYGTIQNQTKPVIISIGELIFPEGDKIEITKTFEVAVKNLKPFINNEASLV
jgi:1-acyl-sn-glycerol-3-phosphate acyltransferase